MAEQPWVRGKRLRYVDEDDKPKPFVFHAKQAPPATSMDVCAYFLWRGADQRASLFLASVAQAFHLTVEGTPLFVDSIQKKTKIPVPQLAWEQRDQISDRLPIGLSYKLTQLLEVVWRLLPHDMLRLRDTEGPWDQVEDEGILTRQQMRRYYTSQRERIGRSWYQLCINASDDLMEDFRKIASDFGKSELDELKKFYAKFGRLVRIQ